MQLKYMLIMMLGFNYAYTMQDPLLNIFKYGFQVTQKYKEEQVRCYCTAQSYTQETLTASIEHTSAKWKSFEFQVKNVRPMVFVAWIEGIEDRIFADIFGFERYHD